MKQKRASQHHWVNILTTMIILLNIPAALFISGCQAGATVQSGPNAVPPPTASATVTDKPVSAPSPTLPDTANDAAKVAGSWAEAVKVRDGKAQYALMTKALQAKVYAELTGLNWVTGTSSPWVVSYAVQKTNTGVRVTFSMATSAGSAGSYSQDLTFRTEDGALKINSISEIHDATLPVHP